MRKWEFRSVPSMSTARRPIGGVTGSILTVWDRGAGTRQLCQDKVSRHSHLWLQANEPENFGVASAIFR
jgi:hypothetical protein